MPLVLIDTREQSPWEFSAEIPTARRKLSSGDYSLDGSEDTVAIERKSLDDYVRSAIHDWMRFRKELRRLAAFDLACVAVEANADDIVGHRYTSDVHPNSLIGRTHSILIDYGVPVFFWGPRAIARHTAERFLLLAAKRRTGTTEGVGSDSLSVRVG